MLIIVALFFITAGAGSYFYSKANSPEIDKNTFCPKSGAESVTALLIDATDSLSVQQKQAFIFAFQSLRDAIPLHGRLDLYFIHSTQSSLLKPVASLCNPGHGDAISPLIGNPRHVEQMWQDGFGQPLEREISQLLDASPENESPIMESIQSVVLTSLSEPSLRDKTKKLIIVSDLMQHTSDLSLYRGALPTENFFQNKSFERMKSDLRDIDISVWMLVRDNALNRSKLAELWQRIFAEQGAQNAYFCVLVESNGCQNDR
ncbi:hypothetical protein [Methylomicrobium lacus]|uniref:hypothetical protein n=1 Tax=Methylomicrobium lacus TaxID=136992 RepID=UPI0035A84AF4